MVKTYRKGYMAERELVHKLYEIGYAVMRSPRSGRINLPSPDIVAIKNGKVVVIECKSRTDAFTVPLEQLEELKEWERRAGAEAYVGWKISRKGWSFFNVDDIIKNNGNISKSLLEKIPVKKLEEF